MDNAQLYLSLVRPSMIPVVGESADDRFIKQIEVSGWKWGFHNVKEQREAQQRRERVGRRADFLEKSNRSRGLEESIKRIERTHKDRAARDNYSKEIADLKKLGNDPKALTGWIESFEKREKEIAANKKSMEEEIASLYRDNDAEEDAKKAQRTDAERRRDEQQRRELDDKELELALENQKFQFSFSKRIDLATTQMLNSMKAGDVFPVAIFTMHQHSSNNPMSLVIKIEGLRLLKYGFAVDATDTMTDLKEEWSCDFKMFSYVYQNRRSFDKPSVGSVSDAKQTAAKAVTQGTVRTFIMLPRKL